MNRFSCVQLLESIMAAAAARKITSGADLARLANVPAETLTRIRRRGTAEYSTLAKLAAAAGLEIHVTPASARVPETAPLSQRLELGFPYDWSNPNMPEDKLIGLVLQKNRFDDVARVCLHFGLGRVQEVAQQLGLAQLPELARTIENVKIGFAQAQHA